MGQTTSAPSNRRTSSTASSSSGCCGGRRKPQEYDSFRSLRGDSPTLAFLSPSILTKQEIPSTISSDPGLVWDLGDACARGDDLKAMSLLSQGVNPTRPLAPRIADTPLHRAAWKGMVSVVQQMCRIIEHHNLNIDPVDIRGDSPLLYVIQRDGVNQTEIAKILISHGASLSLKNVYGETALLKAQKVLYENGILKDLVEFLESFETDVETPPTVIAAANQMDASVAPSTQVSAQQ
eukprot:GILK01005819.1.p1 GENE.GILK01005819.1~~GILK01005819.1.p1  ORF type:complete len:236 (+),score=37.09 GILK01005819.1:101-808(+)